MRILIVANNDVGLYKFRRELIERLIADNNEVTLSLPEGDFVTRFIDAGCSFIPCEFDRHGTNPLAELKQIKYYKKLLLSVRPDIVFTYTIKPNAYCGSACASLNIPYVANITGLGTAIENGGLLQKIALFLYKYGLRKAQKVFFQNTENRDFMLKHKVIRTSYDMLPGSGVNLAQYKILPYPDSETVDFVFISRIMKEKGIDQYLDAARVIRKKYPESRFHICGFCEQEYEEKLNKLHDAGVIIYHGLVDDIVGIHKFSSCTIHPTYYPEGLSNVLLESSACGRPIITTDRAGCREVIDDGVNGYIVKQQDSTDLIEKIEVFLSLSGDQRKKMGLAGRKKVERDFDRQIVVEKYMNEINSI